LGTYLEPANLRKAGGIGELRGSVRRITKFLSLRPGLSAWYVPAQIGLLRTIREMLQATGVPDMALPPGSTIRLSTLRRMMCDLMHFSRKVPLVAVERRMPLRDLIEARHQLTPKPSWFAVFLKAYALVAEQRDELRRSFLSFPRARLHQHKCNVASLAVARQIADEHGVLLLQIRHPERLPLSKIDEAIRRARTEPLEQFADFRRQLRVSRLPWPLRRLAWWMCFHMSGDWRARYAGTFGVTGTAALGSTPLHLLSPMASTLTYGVFAEDGSAPVQLFFDHRVLDGAQASLALEHLERMLHESLLTELRGSARRAA
jgi:hypothetical protein